MADNDFYNDCPCICETTGEQRIKAKKIYSKFSSFQGDSGYSVSEDSVQAFVEQFPPKLRMEALNMTNSIRVLARQSLIDHLRKNISDLKDKYEELLLVPLSESSGKVMKSSLGETENHIYSCKSMTDALGIPYEKIRNRKFAVLIYDDNLISGTQALAQFNYWENNEVGSEEVNINTTELPKEKLNLLKNVDLYFSFNVTWSMGRKRLEDFLSQNGFKNVNNRILFEHEIESLSKLSTASQDFKQYLKKIGEMVYKQKMKRDIKYTESDILERAPKRALGFDNLEGLFITGLNVPTATITALWCPGLVELGDVRFPWKPLFIRTNSFKHFIW